MPGTVLKELVASAGDPQGIGPEIAVRAALSIAKRRPELAIVIVGPEDALRTQEGARDLESAEDGTKAGVRILASGNFGTGSGAPPPSAPGGAAALAAIETAFERVRREPRRRALVTAPVSKAAVSLAGRRFTGHTEWLGERCGGLDTAMLFCAPGLRVALATEHVPLADVPRALDGGRLRRKLEVLAAGLRDLFGIPAPRIAVLGLNPHAGEGGLLGDEEERVLAPQIRSFNSGTGGAEGPFSADSFFQPARLAAYHAVLALYHDQGLLPVKCLAFGKAVNVTLGLPIVRTSVDHGCAYELAGTGRADFASMTEALELARNLLEARASRDGGEKC